MAKYSKERIEEIREHLAELERRGIPIRRFAEEIGVSAWTVYTWKRRFLRGTGPRRRPRAAPVKGGVELIEVEGAPLPGAIEIVVGGVIVRVPPGCETRDLESALRAVRAC